MRLATEYMLVMLPSGARGNGRALPGAGVTDDTQRATARVPGATAVLLSAGLDSAVLAAAEARHGAVHPVYVSVGLAWEANELAMLAALLATPPYASLAQLARLSFPAADVYSPTHWAIVGTPPGFDTPDEDVYLTGRIVMLLSKAGIHCAQKQIGRIAIGPLAGNPFTDATPEFFPSMSHTL